MNGQLSLLLLDSATPRILVTTAHPQSLHHAGPSFGRLIVPEHFPRIADTAAAEIPWAADNGCFQRFDEPRYRRMLRAIRGLPGCLFVTAPDVVGDADTTRALWDEWAPEIRAICGQPVALVAQDGLDVTGVPWDELDALFLGGTTAWKLGEGAARIAYEAKRRGFHVHMGRVNSLRRYTYARQLGCDSVDGTKFSRWRNTWLPDALGWHREPLQERMEI